MNTNRYEDNVPAGSPICPVCHTATDGLASLPTADGGRVHVACVKSAPASPKLTAEFNAFFGPMS